jgi:hypothetical protein
MPYTARRARNRVLVTACSPRHDGVVLPAWATVALSLGSAAIGALAGFGGSWLAYRGTQKSLKHQESQEWRNLQIEACQAMSDAWLEFRWLLYESASGLREFDEKSYGRIGPLGTRCAQCVAKVILLLGAHKPGSAGAAADLVDRRVSQLKDTALNAGTGWSGESRGRIASEIREAEKAHEEFVRKAHLEVRPARDVSGRKT